jgi:hypothetical protein
MKLEYEHFPIYMDVSIWNIPQEHLMPMLVELSMNAMYYMNTENDPKNSAKLMAGIKDMILSDHTYRNMKLHVIAEAFHKGSLGELGGTSRFGLRNVNVWLSSQKEKHLKLITEEKSKIDDSRKKNEETAFRQSQQRSNKYGSALYWKISFCPMSAQEYDRLSLDKIVAMMEKGYKLRELTPEMIL